MREEINEWEVDSIKPVSNQFKTTFYPPAIMECRLCRTTSAAQLTPPTSDTQCLYILYSVHLVWEGGEEVIEKIERQQCTSIVPSSMGATVHKLGRKYQPMSEYISSPVYKIC